MTKQELQQLITLVADGFEQSSDFRVLQTARQALLNPAIPHLDDVTRELERGSITVLFLVNSVRQILDNALDDVRQRGLDAIDDLAIDLSMARYWPYLFGIKYA